VTRIDADLHSDSNAVSDSVTATTEQGQLFTLAGRRVLVLGLGESGCAMARWAHRSGAQLTLADTRSADGGDLPALARLRTELGDVAFFGGEPVKQWLDNIDLVAWSPGLSIETGVSGEFYRTALESGVEVVGELDLFVQGLARLRESGYAPKLIAITGTNGKTTTTAMTAHLLRVAGQSVCAAGNIGPAMLDALMQAMDAGALPAIWVLELSSFQLAIAAPLQADAAALLNLSQDHFDWHTSFETYRLAKQRIFGQRTHRVYNRDDEATIPEALKAEQAARPVESVGRRRATKSGRSLALSAVPSSSFGLDQPTQPGAFGLVVDGPLVWLARAQGDDAAESSGAAGEAVNVRMMRLMPVDALHLRGRHNQANVMAALALACAVGVPLARLLHGLRTYTGEPHRCQLVHQVRGVSFFDDSKGTNVGATAAALQGLGVRCHLIAGGDGKAQDFSPLALPVSQHAVAVYLIGRDADRIRQALTSCGVPLIDCDDLRQAVDAAARAAQAGEAVLLSPACASFDMFRNYAHRAEVFVEAVRDYVGACDLSEALA
jgi:UDP-N-acetylmuramoylalanine--D-glutamate ligase